MLVNTVRLLSRTGQKVDRCSVRTLSLWGHNAEEDRFLNLKGQKVDRCSVRTTFWWGHDTEEDKQERLQHDKRKGLIKWSDPDKAVDQKKEYVWAPARAEDEAAMTIGMTQGMFNHVDTLKWLDKKLVKANWHTWMTDPMR